jgi:hypothetical protein
MGDPADTPSGAGPARKSNAAGAARRGGDYLPSSFFSGCQSMATGVAM